MLNEGEYLAYREGEKGLCRTKDCLSWGWFVSRKTFFVYYYGFQSLKLLSGGGPMTLLPVFFVKAEVTPSFLLVEMRGETHLWLVPLPHLSC